MSYVIADVSESNVGGWISLAKNSNIGMIEIDDWFASVGTYGISPTAFPDGLAGLQSVVDQIHNAGLKVGVHTGSMAITTNDPYVIAGDPRLDKDVSFTLAQVTGPSDATIYVNEDIPTWLPTGNGGNVLQIGNELIQYTGYNTTQHCFTGCTPAFGTTVPTSNYSQNTAIGHVLSLSGYFCPDPTLQVNGKTLVDEIADNLAAVVNDVNGCGIDMVYLDSLWGPTRYDRVNYTKAIAESFDHPVRVEPGCGGWDAYMYTYWSVSGAIDYPHWGDDQDTDVHVAFNEASPYLPSQLGWSAIRNTSPDDNATTPEEWEYLCSQSVGNGYPLSFECLSPTSPANGRQADYLAMYAKYQKITVDAATKAAMSVPGNEFHLETLPDGSLHLAQVNYTEQTADSDTAGSQTWTVNNSYGTQAPTMRIEALTGVESYTGSSVTVTGDSSGNMPTVPATGGMTPGINSASMTWTACPANDPTYGGPSQNRSMLFSATNGSVPNRLVGRSVADVFGEYQREGGPGSVDLRRQQERGFESSTLQHRRECPQQSLRDREFQRLEILRVAVPGTR